MKTLEQEFAEYKGYHMYEMSVTALIMHGEDGLYNNDLLKGYKDLELTGREKAYYIIDDLYDKMQDGESDLYYQVYEMCWKSIEDEIAENKSFRINVNYES